MKAISYINVLLILLITIPSSYAQLAGRVEKITFLSKKLGIQKDCSIYLPSGYDYSAENYPVVYFLRLRAGELFETDAPGRYGKALQHVADSLMENGIIGKMIIVSPSSGGFNGWPGLVNMLRPDLSKDVGIGTGKFEDYFFNDLIPYIDKKYRTMSDRQHRGIDGFSWGGYCSLTYSLRNPHLFSSVGSYEAPLMWYNLDDPNSSEDPPNDQYWFNSIFDPIDNEFYSSVFGSPRDTIYMLKHNPINIIADANKFYLQELRSINFHIQTAAIDPYQVHFIERNQQLIELMKVKGIHNSFSNLILSPQSTHSYGYADLYASKSLVKHWETFQQITLTVNSIDAIPSKISLFQNYPNPFNPTTTIKYSVPLPEKVQIKIIDVLGSEIKTILNEYKQSGTYEIDFDASGLQSGVYFYRIFSNNYSETKKMILLK